MSQRTPTIGLKKPEGSDPFLTADFAENYDRIDAAFAQRPVGGSGGTGGAHPDSDHTGLLTKAQADGYYVQLSHLTGHATGDAGGGTAGITQDFADARYAFKDHGVHGGGGTTDATVVKSPGRSNPRTIFTNIGFTLNNANGVNNLNFNYSEAAFTGAPQVLATVQVGSNYDILVNIQGRTAVDASFRCAQIKGISITTTGTLCVMAIGI